MRHGLYAALQQAAAFFAHIGILCIVIRLRASSGAFHACHPGVAAGLFCSAMTDSCTFLALSCSIHCINKQGKAHTTRMAASAVQADA